MPWCPHLGPPGEIPAHYWPPNFLPDDVVLGRQYCVDYAKQRRKEVGQHRELLLRYQADCGKSGDREGAKFFKDEAADAMKQYRGWDFSIRYMEGDPMMIDWRRKDVSEPIAPYLDRAFEELSYCGAPKEAGGAE